MGDEVVKSASAAKSVPVVKDEPVVKSVKKSPWNLEKVLRWAMISFLVISVISLFLRWGTKKIDDATMYASFFQMNIWFFLFFVLVALVLAFLVCNYDFLGSGFVLMVSFFVSFFVFFVYNFAVETTNVNTFGNYIVDFIPGGAGLDGLGVLIFIVSVVALFFLSYFQFLVIYARKRFAMPNIWKKIKWSLVIFVVLVLLFFGLLYGSYLFNVQLSDKMSLDAARCLKTCSTEVNEDGVEIVGSGCFYNCYFDNVRELYPSNYGMVGTPSCYMFLDNIPEYQSCLDKFLEEYNG